ncbi:hypothetical protein BDP27DRAFT_1425927 [Rhodocollybia butyracea]|uniref:Uncharacterized protein n=1 Tax=Rhodocollybia butyracea TaxID=206335 RepID=A0A9P5PLY0_9AGAR|nr:hypothetical protein BDP27DRAFT_1425927 [Rhodocollybia butyracea]
MALAFSFLSSVHSLHLPDASSSPVVLFDLSSQGIQEQLLNFKQYWDQEGLSSTCQSLVDVVVKTVTLRCCWGVKEQGLDVETCFRWIEQVRRLGEDFCIKSSRFSQPSPAPALPPSPIAPLALVTRPTLDSDAPKSSRSSTILGFPFKPISHPRGPRPLLNACLYTRLFNVIHLAQESLEKNQNRYANLIAHRIKPMEEWVSSQDTPIPHSSVLSSPPLMPGHNTLTPVHSTTSLPLSQPTSDHLPNMPALVFSCAAETPAVSSLRKQVKCNLHGPFGSLLLRSSCCHSSRSGTVTPLSSPTGTPSPHVCAPGLCSHSWRWRSPISSATSPSCSGLLFSVQRLQQFSQDICSSSALMEISKILQRTLPIR